MDTILVEVGIVLGWGLPTLIVVEPPGEPIPALFGVSTVNSRTSDSEALRLHLRMFLRSAKEAITKAGVQPSTSPLENASATVDVWSSPAQGGFAQTSGLAFERNVAELLRGAGVILESRETVGGGTADIGIDLAFSLPGREKTLGPVVVEVKQRLRSREDLRRCENRLIDFMEHGQSGLGMVIYHEVDFPISKAPLSPFVIALSIDELLDLVRSGRFGERLVQFRNHAAHGS